ncbi:MAG TPA: NAD(P)-dependent alcohol dehydrogenase [Hyphomicrobiales bacterium]|nr:NAD(P)-dependent alcohol dehydrogenase [Hyphomicrobiales bacterium]
MRSYHLSPGAGIDSLTMVEGPEPRPARRQILVKVAACSLNARDLGIASGAYPSPLKPLVPLSDAAGEVVEIGPDVTRFVPGDRVVSCFFQAWPGGRPTPAAASSALGGALQGVLAEYVVIEEDGAVKCPEPLSLEEGATLPCAAVTAWHAVAEYGDVRAPDTILVLGTGGVSVFALQIGKLLGARVVALSSSAAKIERLAALGADICLDYGADVDWGRTVAARTGGGVDHVVEVGGGATFANSLAALRSWGKVSVIGGVGGAGTINPLAILAKRANVQGISVGSTEMAERLCAAIAAGGLRPVIDTVFPFAEARRAFAHLQRRDRLGKIVINLDQGAP